MWSCGVDEKETDVKHLISLTGVLTSDITINQNCIFKYWFFKGKKNILHFKSQKIASNAAHV